MAIDEKRKKGRNMTAAERKWCVAEEKRRHEMIRGNGKELTSMMHVITYNTVSRTITGMYHMSSIYIDVLNQLKFKQTVVFSFKNVKKQLSFFSNNCIFFQKCKQTAAIFLKQLYFLSKI